MDIQTTKFQELWKDFIDSFKGNLITESRNQEITFAIAKMALREAVSTWTSEYTINGRWLYKLLKSEPAKGELVKEILTKDIRLSEVGGAGSKSDSMKYFIPLAAGAIGYGIAHLAKFATVGTACATLVPMAVAYPVTVKYLSDRKDKYTESMINAYVGQLNKYRESIMSALLAQ